MIQSITGVKCARQVLSLGKKSPFSGERNHFCFFGKMLGTLLPHRNQTRLLINWSAQPEPRLRLRKICPTYLDKLWRKWSYLLKNPTTIFQRLLTYSLPRGYTLQTSSEDIGYFQELGNSYLFFLSFTTILHKLNRFYYKIVLSFNQLLKNRIIILFY